MAHLISKLHHRVRKTGWLGRLLLRAMPDLPWVVNVKPIGRIAIRLRQHRMYWLRPPLTFEGFMLGGLQRLVRKGDVVYDIGANIGLYSRFIAQYCQASKVYAFEPVGSNCRLFTQNMSLGGCESKVVLLPLAAGNEDGTFAFQVDDLTSNSGSLDAVRSGRASQSRAQYGMPPRTVSVPVTRLDSLMERNEIAKPDVLKLDVEGAEALVLEGAAHLLSQHECRLVIELHGPEVGREVSGCSGGMDTIALDIRRRMANGRIRKSSRAISHT